METPLIQDGDFQDEFRSLARQAVHILNKIMQNGDSDKTSQAQARVAATALTAWTRYLQGERIQAVTTFAMAERLARNPDEFRQYVRIAMPDNPMVKAIPVPAALTVGGNNL